MIICLSLLFMPIVCFSNREFLSAQRVVRVMTFNSPGAVKGAVKVQ